MEIKKFDYIVYFASLAGVVFSIQKARLGKKVLLLNQVGFPGGSITENLNLEQNIPVEIKSYTMLNIIKKIKKYSNGILFQKETQVILNPEAVKFVLQDELTNSNVNLLFHIRLNKIEIKENSFIVSVVGREGELTFECENLIDASEEFSMSDLGKVGERKLQFRRYNLVTSLIANEEFLNKDYLIGKIKIDDGRYWLSLKNEEKDELLYEHKSHEIVNQLTEDLLKNKSRTQLLPIATQSIYSIEQKMGLSNFKILYKKLPTKYNRHKLFELTDNLNYEE